MTAVSPFDPAALRESEAMMQDIVNAMMALNKLRTANKARFQQWSQTTLPGPQGGEGNPAFAAICGMILFDSLFGGMPLFGGLTISPEMAQGLGATAMALNNEGHSLEDAETINAAMLMATRGRFQKVQAAERKKAHDLEELKKLAALFMKFVQDQEESGDTGKGGDHLAADVLREPKLARFKQNRASISCIRTMFNRQANVIAPHFDAPELAA